MYFPIYAILFSSIAVAAPNVQRRREYYIDCIKDQADRICRAGRHAFCNDLGSVISLITGCKDNCSCYPMFPCNRICREKLEKGQKLEQSKTEESDPSVK